MARPARYLADARRRAPTPGIRRQTMQFPVETIEEAAAATTKDQLDTRMYFAVVAAILAIALVLLV
jgi:hypothetical protein